MDETKQAQQPINIQPQAQQPIAAHQAPSKSNKFLHLAVVAVFSALLGSLITYLIMSSNQYAQTRMSMQQKPAVSPTQSVTAIPTQQSTAENFIKRQFDINKQIKISENNFIDYPKEIVNINENNLIGMKCSPYIWYGYDSDSYLYYDESVSVQKDTKTLTDKRLLKLITEAQKTVPGKTIGDVRFCDIEDNRTVLQYGIHGGGGGSENTANFGVVNADGTVKKITAISNDGAPYFECRQPLQLTKTNLLYYECGGGDGLLGATSFYKINLSNNSHSAVLKCTSVGSETEPVKITCK